LKNFRAGEDREDAGSGREKEEEFRKMNFGEEV
jgi:hypothetical protein